MPTVRWLAPWRDRIALPLRAAAFAGAAAAAVALALPDHYVARARLLPNEPKSLGGMSQLLGTAALLGLQVGQDGGDANYVDIIKSETLRASVCSATYRYRLRGWRFGAVRQVEGTLYDYFGSQDATVAEARMADLLVAYRDLKSKILVVEVATRSPDLSRQVAERVLAGLEGFLHERTRTRGGAKVLFADERLEAARSELARSEATFKAFLERNHAYQVSPDPAVHLRGLGLEADYKLKHQVVASLTVSREQALLEEKDNLPVLSVLDPPGEPTRPSGPHRTRLVLASALAAAALAGAWERRAWFQARFGAWRAWA